MSAALNIAKIGGGLRSSQCQWAADPPRLLPSIASTTMAAGRTMDYPARVWGKPPHLVLQSIASQIMQRYVALSWNNIANSIFSKMCSFSSLWTKNCDWRRLVGGWVGKDRILIEQLPLHQQSASSATSLKEKYWILSNTFHLPADAFHMEKLY